MTPLPARRPRRGLEHSPEGLGRARVPRTLNLSANPPGPGKKEGKANVRSVSGAGWGVLNFVTEAMDFVDVLHDSLPKKCQAKKKTRADYQRGITPHAKAQAIYDCFEEIDLATAITNYINNQFEDAVYGTLGAQTGRASRNFGVSTGLDRALRQAEDAATGDEPIKLPELVYDEETGEFSVDGGSFFGQYKLPQVRG